MRKPRPEAFDPQHRNATNPKPEDVDLSDAVPLKIHRDPAPEPNERKNESSEIRSEKRTEYRTENRSVQLPVKRRTKRYSFEFYDDQLTRLKQIKYETEIRGECIAISEIVRRALDDYFQRMDKSVR